MASNKSQKQSLYIELNSQKDLLKTVRQNEAKYATLIEERNKESLRIDKEIEDIIKREIARANAAKGKKASETFALTPEAKLVARSFESNKGKLIWPVEKGVKSLGFGIYKDKLYPGIKHQNSGVNITTEKGAGARAIFEGEVMNVKTDRLGRKVIYVRHGNFIATYFNLKNAYVKKGDKVQQKTKLGQVYTNPRNDRTELKFVLFQNTKKLNPEQWIYQL